MDKSNQLAVDYKNRLKECEDDHFLRLRAGEWLLDSCQRIVKDVRDDNQQILENSIRG